jgi:type I restriction enzyme S subunit
MNGWQQATLGEVCSLVTDGKHGDCHNEESSGYYFISAKDIRDGRINYENARQITQDDFAETHRRTDLKPGDLLITNSGTIGRMAIAADDERTPRTTFQKSVAVLKLKPQEALSRYLYYYLNANLAALIHPAAGAAQKNLLLGDIRRFRISKPSLDDQERIVATISVYDDLIENNRRRIGLLEEAARLLYREWFVHFRFPGHEHVKITNGLPYGWEPRKLADLVDVVKETIKPSNFAEDDIHIGLEHIPRRSFTLSDWEPAGDLASGKTRFQEGDILFGKIRPYFHKVGFALRSGLASSDAIVMRVNDEQDWPLVVCATTSDQFVAVSSKTVREGSKMPRADWNVLKKYLIPKPPGSILQVFNDNVEAITAQCKSLVFQNRALTEARDLLLPRLMNGEIAV